MGRRINRFVSTMNESSDAVLDMADMGNERAYKWGKIVLEEARRTQREQADLTRDQRHTLLDRIEIGVEHYDIHPFFSHASQSLRHVVGYEHFIIVIDERLSYCFPVGRAGTNQRFASIPSRSLSTGSRMAV